jgi:hypothetical protein
VLGVGGFGFSVSLGWHAYDAECRAQLRGERLERPYVRVPGDSLRPVPTVRCAVALSRCCTNSAPMHGATLPARLMRRCCVLRQRVLPRVVLLAVPVSERLVRPMYFRLTGALVPAAPCAGAHGRRAMARAACPRQSDPYMALWSTLNRSWHVNCSLWGTAQYSPAARHEPRPLRLAVVHLLPPQRNRTIIARLHPLQ